MDAEETRIYYILWIAVVLLGIVIWYFFIVMISNFSQNKKKMEQQLDEQVRKADEDRLNFAGQLHNDVQPLLTAISRNIEMCKIDPEKAAFFFKEAGQLINDSLLLTSDLTKMILPYKVKTSRLPVAIYDMVNRLNEEVKLVLLYDELPLLEEKCLLSICRLLQEIIYNTIKHSRATRLKIDMRYQGNQLTIRTAEEGWTNRSSTNKAGKPGVGLDLMKSRIRLLKGVMHVKMDKIAGTRYVIIIPVNHTQILPV